MAVVGVDAAIVDSLLWYIGQMTTTPALAVAYPGIGFSPSLGVPYLDVNVMPNTADAPALPFNGYVDRQGLLQISTFWPARQGLLKPMQIASQVATYFGGGARISRNGIVVQFNDQARVASSLQESDWLQVPVIIPWRCVVDPGR